MTDAALKPICTFRGKVMYPLAPKVEDFDIDDIAHALSQMTRANGHFKTFYSVAQHCLACSKEGEARHYSPRLCRALLLHDASEAYLSDITRPVKISLPEYCEIENNLLKVLFEAFGIGALTEEEEKMISVIDDAMLYYEFERLHADTIFHEKYELTKEYDLSFRDMQEVEAAYLERYRELIRMENANDRSN